MLLITWFFINKTYLNFQCNNPKTKEPKLKAAARIIPEWVEYDNEIRQLLDQLEKKKENASKS